MTLLKQITILIVDDNIDFHTVATAMLNRKGYQVVSLYHGLFENIVESASSCDILLLDVDLPHGSGSEITRRLKDSREFSHLPIILISGSTELEKLCTEASADGYLGKPFSGAQLINEVERHLT